jgi:hypothetical protein
MIRRFEHDFFRFVGQRNGLVRDFRKARVLRRVFGRFGVRYRSVRGRDEAREIPVVVDVVRVLEANITELGCHARKGTASSFRIAIECPHQHDRKRTFHVSRDRQND